MRGAELARPLQIAEDTAHFSQTFALMSPAEQASQLEQLKAQPQTQASLPKVVAAAKTLQESTSEARPVAPLRLRAHLAHQPLDPPARVPPALPAQLDVNPSRTTGPPAGGGDPADMAAQPGLCLGPSLDGRDRVPPGVAAAATDADHPAQRGHRVVRPLGGNEHEPAHAIPRVKKAAAFLADLDLLLEPLVLPFQPLQLGLLRLVLSQRLRRAGCHVLVAPCAELAAAQPQLARRLAQPLAAILPSWDARIDWRNLHFSRGSPVVYLRKSAAAD